jgi:hypothetical protein
MDSQLLGIISLAITVVGFVLLYSINTNLKKTKQLLFGIMYLLNEQRKDEGKEGNLQDIYQKGKNL